MKRLSVVKQQAENEGVVQKIKPQIQVSSAAEG
jgi:hypothetical protein